MKIQIIKTMLNPLFTLVSLEIYSVFPLYFFQIPSLWIIHSSLGTFFAARLFTLFLSLGLS